MKSIGAAWLPALLLIGAIVLVAVLFKKFVSKEGSKSSKNLTFTFFSFKYKLEDVKENDLLPVISCLFYSPNFE